MERIHVESMCISIGYRLALSERFLQYANKENSACIERASCIFTAAYRNICKMTNANINKINKIEHGSGPYQLKKIILLLPMSLCSLAYTIPKS